MPHFGIDDYTLISWEAGMNKQRYGKAQNYVIRFLEKNGASDISSIENSADVCTPSAARQSVYSLASLGVVRRTNPGAPKGTPAIYELVKSE